ncbi:MAG: GntR family transcriptional regulator [Rubrimonas sp.]
MRKDDADIYAALLDAIDRGDFAPGARLVEADLADRFGVSRTPVREALNRLETQGVLARDPRRGVVVASLDYDELGELYAVREVAEGFAARMAARHAAPAEIALLQEMVEADRERLSDPRALSQGNKQFHRQLHRASHNRYLIQMLDAMRRSLALLSSSTLAVPERGAQSIEEHAAIVAAIAARDEETAERAARLHIANALKTRLRLEAAG